MNYLKVIIEHNALSLNRPFTYASEIPVAPGCRVAVPFHGKELTGFVIGEETRPDENIQILPVNRIIDTIPMNEELMELAEYISENSCASLISVWKAMLPPALRPQSNHAPIVMEDWFAAGKEGESLTPRQQQAWTMIKEQLPMKASLVRKLTKTLWKPLLEKGYLTQVSRPKSMLLAQGHPQDSQPALKSGQAAAIKQIRESDSQVFLLHGVTGSGKTEVFLRLARETLDAGKQVLFLVPEIGLTPMMVQRVAARFGDGIAVYHSGLSAQEKYAQYELVRQGKVRIVVGTRSACFMPFDDLGLILMDEEHDNSYKQDAMPRYHTRDVVCWRASYHHCKLILASATPSLDSYARAFKGLYELVMLPERINKTMPDIQLVDMKSQRITNGLSQTLIDGITRRLARHEQVILLLNRRGYLPIVRCLDCKTVRTCPDCGIALSYHKKENKLVCHCCDRQWNFDPLCPECGSRFVAETGMGTEKLAEAVQVLFPQARIVRMDADSTRKKNAHDRLLAQFEKEGDILIGTQMVAKGLDFPRVTLVGILQTDNALARTDFRTSETAYAMIEQASGRAGRADRPGEVMIQTFEPDHYVLQAVRNHDYQGFFSREMKYRHMGGYPPYTYMCTLIFTHAQEDKARNRAEEVRGHILAAQPALRVLGPAPISMRLAQPRVRLVIKAKDDRLLKETMWDVIHRYGKGSVKIDINMHPLMLEE